MGRCYTETYAPSGTIFGTSLPADVDTLFLVDVDGVLNVGAREESGIAPLLLNAENAERAFRLAHKPNSDRSMMRSAERIISLWTRRIPEEDGRTYASFVCDSPNMLSPVLVERLARIMRCAGDRWAAVLSSSWRKTKHARKVSALEAAVSKQLGQRFAFSAATPLMEERCASDRFHCLMTFIQDLYRAREIHGIVGRPLRMVILEDFFISPPATWGYFGCHMDSVDTGEAFLEGAAPPGANFSVKIIHTYDEWATASGLRVAVGAGISGRAMREAISYLRRTEYMTQEVAHGSIPGGLKALAYTAGNDIDEGLALADGQNIPPRLQQPQCYHAPFIAAGRMTRCWHMLPAWPWLAAAELGQAYCATTVMKTGSAKMTREQLEQLPAQLPPPLMCK